MSMPPMHKPSAKGPNTEARDRANEEHQREQAERGRKMRIMTARIEPTEENADLGRYRFEASLAISAKRIADTLEQILVELRRQNAGKA